MKRWKTRASLQQGLALLSRPVRPPERYGASVHAPLERYDVHAEALTRAVVLEAALPVATTFFAGADAPFPRFAFGEFADEKHPEHDHRFSIAKRARYWLGFSLVVIGVPLFWLPIPFGLATMGVGISLMSTAVPYEHAKAHAKQIFNVLSTPITWLLNTPPMRALRKDIFYGTFADVWGPPLAKKADEIRTRYWPPIKNGFQSVARFVWPAVKPVLKGVGHIVDYTITEIGIALTYGTFADKWVPPLGDNIKKAARWLKNLFPKSKHKDSKDEKREPATA